MADLMNQEYDHLFKVLLLGDSGTGKSSLILRYTEDTFNSSLVSSIGVDFKVKNKIIDGKVNINGKILKDDVYGITDYIDIAGIAESPITLKDDEYFCLGDNRPVSRDSRFEEVGPVTKDEIIGKVWIRIWPLNEFGNVDK